MRYAAPRQVSIRCSPAAEHGGRSEDHWSL